MTIHLNTFISDQGLCEDLLKRESYIIPFFFKGEQCVEENVECKICHKIVGKKEEEQ